MHGCCQAAVQHLFTRLCYWRVVRDIMTGSSCKMHARTQLILHFMQFQLHTQKGASLMDYGNVSGLHLA